jgi:hypothetical protein
VRSNDQPRPLDFEAVITPDHVSLSSASKITPFLLALKITNRTSESILINTFDTPVPYLTPKGGKTIIPCAESDAVAVPDKSDLTSVPALHSIYIVVPCFLEKTENKWALRSGLLRDGDSWNIEGIHIGSYTINLHYYADYSLFPDAVKKAAFFPFKPWSGEADSKGVEFHISD